MGQQRGRQQWQSSPVVCLLCSIGSRKARHRLQQQQLLLLM
jgi:hypothetical protein